MQSEQSFNFIFFFFTLFSSVFPAKEADAILEELCYHFNHVKKIVPDFCYRPLVEYELLSVNF